MTICINKLYVVGEPMYYDKKIIAGYFNCYSVPTINVFLPFGHQSKIEHEALSKLV